MTVKEIHYDIDGYIMSEPPLYIGDADTYLYVYPQSDYVLRHKPSGILRNFICIKPYEFDQWEEIPDNFD